MSMNKVILVGHMANDPELKYTQSGVPFSNFRVASQRPYANAQGEREADFIDVVAWRQDAEFVANHLTKGSLVGVDGRLQVRSYTDQEGNRRRITEVVADSVRGLGGKSNGNGNGNAQRGNNGGRPAAGREPQEEPEYDSVLAGALDE